MQTLTIPQWASIEILCACIVANTAFFYTLVKDFQSRSHSHASNNGTAASNFYMQSLQSSSRCGDERPRRPSRTPKTTTKQETSVEEMYVPP